MTEKELNYINSNAGTDIFFKTANNGEENRRAYQTKPWKSDYEIYKQPSPNNHEYVDLGLPSGTLWATCNIGATTPDEPGLYFAWGETQGYTEAQVGHDKNFSWEDYELTEDDGATMTRYNDTDGKTELESGDDAATVNWGSNWKMPTQEQFQELIDETTNAWDSERSGWTFTSSNGNSLFLFAAGCAEDGVVLEVGEFGDYWSSSLNSENVSSAWCMDFGGNGCNVNYADRFYGYSVRPVYSKN